MRPHQHPRDPSVEYEWKNDPAEAEDRRIAAIKYLSESAAFRNVSQGIDPAEWPVYLLDDTAIYKEDGSIGNLLNAELEGDYTVRGRLAISKDQLKDLKSSKYHNFYVEFKTSMFSIGSGPITLWATGEGRYFEIRPSRRYNAMYRHIAEAISTYFNLTDAYENLRIKKQAIPVDRILFEYGYLDGGGLNLSGCIERVKCHGLFLLSQMKKHDGIQWPSTIFYQWLSYQCLDTYMALMKKSTDGQFIKVPVPINLPICEPTATDSYLDLFIPPKPTKAKGPKRKKSLVNQRQVRKQSLSNSLRVEILSALHSDSSDDDEVQIIEKPQNFSQNSKSITKSHAKRAPVDFEDMVADLTSRPDEATKDQKSSLKYSGPIVLPSTYDQSTSLGMILTLIYAAVHLDLNLVPAKHFYRPEQLGYKKIAVALYNLCKIKSRESPPISDQLFANAIVEYYASDIIDSLHPSWQSTQLYQQLRDVADLQARFTNKDKILYRWPEISKYKIERRQAMKKFNEYSNPRKSGPGGTPFSTPTSSNTPAALRTGQGQSGKKIIPYPYDPNHRRSGKEAGLRLVTPAKRDSESISSSVTPEVEVQQVRQSKKRRRALTPPEMGPDSDEEESESREPSLEIPDHSTLSDVKTGDSPALPDSSPSARVRAATTAMTVVSIPITQEGCFVSGRMGSWVCSYCNLVIWDPETVSGLASARKHMLDEAARIERENLIEAETMKTRLPSSHLLDLLRERGREAREKEERERMVGEKMAPIPIRRANY